MARRVADLINRVRNQWRELIKFGIVGGIGTVVDLGGAAALHNSVGPLKAKAISIAAATVVTYVGSRFWTFRHRDNQPLLREGMLFFGLNVIGLIIAEAVIAFTTYALGYKDPVAYNIASVIGTGLGTIFRWFAYRKWVFLTPAEPATAAGPLPAASAPWEPMLLEPSPTPAQAFSARPIHQPHPARLHSQNPVVPNGAGAPPLATAAAPSRQAAPARSATFAWDDAPARDDAPMWPTAPVPTVPAHSASRSAPHSAPAGSRAPGRHRKPPSH